MASGFSSWEILVRERFLVLGRLEEGGDEVGGGKVCLVSGVYNDGGSWLLLEGEGLEKPGEGLDLVPGEGADPGVLAR